MNLYIFEPYSWSYCGGTLGVIAESFDEAVALLLKERDFYKKLEFRKSYFDRSKFKEDHENQWENTHVLQLAGNPEPQVLFKNWNYS